MIDVTVDSIWEEDHRRKRAMRPGTRYIKVTGFDDDRVMFHTCDKQGLRAPGAKMKSSAMRSRFGKAGGYLLVKQS